MSRIIESILKKNTIRNHEYVLKRFREQFDERQLDTIRADEILAFLTQLTGGKKQTTKRVRYSLLKAFFNFIKNTIDPNLQNPCDMPIMRKIFKSPKLIQWTIFEKETVNEINEGFGVANIVLNGDIYFAFNLYPTGMSALIRQNIFLTQVDCIF